MTRIGLIVAALLFSNQSGMASAAENPEHQSKHARKLLVALENLGLDHPDLVGLVKTVDERTDNGYLRLAEDRVMDGTLTLHYELGGGIKKKQLELRYVPDDSNIVYTVRSTAVMANYSFKF